jgi:hypothetical protein
MKSTDIVVKSAARPSTCAEGCSALLCCTLPHLRLQMSQVALNCDRLIVLVYAFMLLVSGLVFIRGRFLFLIASIIGTRRSGLSLRLPCPRRPPRP